MTLLQFAGDHPVFSFLTILIVAAVTMNITSQLIQVFASRKK